MLQMCQHGPRKYEHCEGIGKEYVFAYIAAVVAVVAASVHSLVKHETCTLPHENAPHRS